MLGFSWYLSHTSSHMPINKDNLRFRGFNIRPQQDYHLRVFAAQRDVSISEVMRDAVDEYIAKQLANV